MLVRVSSLSDLEEKKPRKFSINGIEVVIVRVGDKVFAIEAYCPHKGRNLEYGEVEGYKIRCDLHGYEYSLENGELIFNPYGKTSGWYFSPNLRIYKVEIKGKDIFIQI
ncbi:Rieske (2Fe-2S) protein [Saccharolobus solfataricus]|uniref:Archaeal Rieske-type ferredoxin (Arf) n=3 Tax=Saccharolobus solfataricus TaxID=2287 RepID=Q7LYJ7_SACS2|nr:Rieske (2Fe-2S) protein [Saccharolobus solfataricus]AAK42261.1 Archaeal Rieske-type ferredoxin (arf) [Saccharolobus solfataricus P2]AKA74876.1 Rieske (2Fe-2S) protein [Saccharolobus solfataricus]AKA77572.1 Rieske (2Fe-2S) protein [Saccharolobus solfataricus]AKA80262.1 Rieske (2Fe-2S) protein [Saccharolobus solfataricus]AZF69341.1 Rieske (2Fe-2S) protein [Saccharolobus solfataricus]